MRANVRSRLGYLPPNEFAHPMQAGLGHKAQRNIKDFCLPVPIRNHHLVDKDDHKREVEEGNGQYDDNDGVRGFGVLLECRRKGVDDRYHDGHERGKVLNEANSLIAGLTRILDVRRLGQQEPLHHGDKTQHEDVGNTCGSRLPQSVALCAAIRFLSHSPDRAATTTRMADADME